MAHSHTARRAQSAMCSLTNPVLLHSYVYRIQLHTASTSTTRNGTKRHGITCAIAYTAQAHLDDDDAITIVPGSFATPAYDTASARTLHPPKGAVIVFEQRSTHRGRCATLSVLRTAGTRNLQRT